MIKLLITFSVSFIIRNHYTFGQSISALKALDNNYQNCLNSGNNMRACSQKYYFRMDSLLNVAYNKYRNFLTETERQKLKKEQLTWLFARDNYFKQVSSGLKVGEDVQMIAIDEKALFVRERVIYLINKLKP